jgi:hypothetical protein
MTSVFLPVVQMLKSFRLKPFLAGLVVGGFILFFYKAAPTVVVEYPHPDNVETRTYKDKNSVCYKYAANEVDCDKNEGTLKEYPLQG